MEVLVVDCQATGPAPRGHLIEIGWARVAPGRAPIIEARLVRLPAGESLPRRVAALTGLDERALREGDEPASAYRALGAEAASIAPVLGGVPTIIHFASFELPHLLALSRRERAWPALDVLCAHAVAERLFPGLPRRTLRALSGYYGHPLSSLRRSAEHVAATALVWSSLVASLAEQGITTWYELRAFLAGRAKRAPRAYPMPRETRLAAPDAPGVYRMLRVGGSVLYIGKATSLKSRVNSYFRKKSGGSDRTLEMLSQARGLDLTVTATALEAALLEPDEIKAHQPPYNVALREEGREVVHASPDLRRFSHAPGRRYPRGPLPGRDPLTALVALAAAIGSGARADPAVILGIPARHAPSLEVFRLGLSCFVEEHRVPADGGARHLLTLGARLWGEGFMDEEEELDDLEGGEGEEESEEGAEDRPREMDPAAVARALALVAVRAAHALRRGRWLSRLAGAEVVFREPERPRRLLVISGGRIVRRADLEEREGEGAPSRRGPSAPRPVFDVAMFDRLRVLTTELRRLLADGAWAEIRFADGGALAGDRLRRALSWV